MRTVVQSLAAAMPVAAIFSQAEAGIRDTVMLGSFLPALEKWASQPALPAGRGQRLHQRGPGQHANQASAVRYRKVLLRAVEEQIHRGAEVL